MKFHKIKLSVIFLALALTEPFTHAEELNLLQALAIPTKSAEQTVVEQLSMDYCKESMASDWKNRKSFFRKLQEKYSGYPVHPNKSENFFPSLEYRNGDEGYLDENSRVAKVATGCHIDGSTQNGSEIAVRLSIDNSKELFDLKNKKHINFPVSSDCCQVLRYSYSDESRRWLMDPDDLLPIITTYTTKNINKERK